MITPGYVGKKDLIERIIEVRKARRAAVEDHDGEEEAEFDEDAASVASRPVSQNGGSNCREESTYILRLRIQLELARAEKEKVEAEERRVQAEREMMRERVELGFQGEEMRDADAFAAKSLPEIKFFKKWLNRRMMFCHFLMCLERPVLCMVLKVNKLREFCQVC